MKILLCLDYSSFTETILDTTKSITRAIKDVQITVLHIIDEMLFTAGTGYETQLGEQLDSESMELKKLCEQSFGKEVNYIEEYGIPRLKIEELLREIDYDLLIIGSHSRHGLGERLMGSMAEHILRNSTKPVLIIP